MGGRGTPETILDAGLSVFPEYLLAAFHVQRLLRLRLRFRLRLRSRLGDEGQPIRRRHGEKRRHAQCDRQDSQDDPPNGMRLSAADS